MPESHGVILYGSSIFLSGTAAALSQAGVKFRRVKSNNPHPEQTLRALKARVILFDATCETPGWFAGLLQVDPAPVMIGINPNSDTARVVSVVQPLLGGMQDLADLILSELGKASQLIQEDQTIPSNGTLFS